MQNFSKYETFKFKDFSRTFKGLEFFSPNSRTFKDFSRTLWTLLIWEQIRQGNGVHSGVSKLSKLGCRTTQETWKTTASIAWSVDMKMLARWNLFTKHRMSQTVAKKPGRHADWYLRWHPFSAADSLMPAVSVPGFSVSTPDLPEDRPSDSLHRPELHTSNTCFVITCLLTDKMNPNKTTSCYVTSNGKNWHSQQRQLCYCYILILNMTVPRSVHYWLMMLMVRCIQVR